MGEVSWWSMCDRRAPGAGQPFDRRFGKAVLLASRAELPLDGLACQPVRARLVEPDRVRELAAGIHPLTDP